MYRYIYCVVFSSDPWYSTAVGWYSLFILVNLFFRCERPQLMLFEWKYSRSEVSRAKRCTWEEASVFFSTPLCSLCRQRNSNDTTFYWRHPDNLIYTTVARESKIHITTRTVVWNTYCRRIMSNAGGVYVHVSTHPVRGGQQGNHFVNYILVVVLHVIDLHRRYPGKFDCVNSRFSCCGCQ